MLLFEPRHVRRLLLQLSHDEDLHASLRSLCEKERIRSARLIGEGTLSFADVTHFETTTQRSMKPRRFSGDLHVQFSGIVAQRGAEPHVELTATLGYWDNEIGRVACGELVRAGCVQVVVTVESFEDVRLNCGADDEDGVVRLQGDDRVVGTMARPHATQGLVVDYWVQSTAPGADATPPPRHSRSAAGRASATSSTLEMAVVPPTPSVRPQSPSPSVPPGGGSTHGRNDSPSQPSLPATSQRQAGPSEPATSRFGAAQMVSRTRIDEGDAVEIERGDWVEHKQFGLCKVERIDDSGVLVKMHNATRKLLQLSVFDVIGPRQDGDRRVFALRSKQRR